MKSETKNQSRGAAESASPSRRGFLEAACGAAAAATLARPGTADNVDAALCAVAKRREASSIESDHVACSTAQTALPRWRGFNLLYFFGTWHDCKPKEEDYRIISDLGFDFVRLPLWYTHWVAEDDVYAVKEEMLERIDQAVAFGRKHKLHVCLNMHRAPGYCVASEPKEPFDLWRDQEALDAFCFHWELFGKRYKDIPGDELSFNLINEPVTRSRAHERVVRAAVRSIRAVTPDRLILLDGLQWGMQPLTGLEELGVAQSCRGYWPHTITHYKASWVTGADTFPTPRWPIPGDDGEGWDRARLKELYAPWAETAGKGVGVHCGECGCYKHTPHDVFLRWFKDVLDILTAHGIGYALWNLRGPFGILDSERSDVAYEDWCGHKLDRKLLDLLQAH